MITDLNLPLTVEATLEGAKGYLFGKYPTQKALKEGDNIVLDVRHLEEKMPSIALGWMCSLSKKFYEEGQKKDRKIDLKQNPVYVSVCRPDKSVYLFKDEFKTTKGWLTSYFLMIYNGKERYFSSVCSNGMVQVFGEKRLLNEAMQDTELTNYISFIPLQKSYQNGTFFKKWNLNQMMRQARS